MKLMRDTRNDTRYVSHTTPPEPVVGQVWVAPEEKPRTIYTVQPNLVGYTREGCRRIPWRKQWNRWVQRTGARPQ